MNIRENFLQRLQDIRETVIIEMAALPGQKGDPNADEKTIVNILQGIHDHPNKKRYLEHPNGAHHYVQDNMNGKDEDVNKGNHAAASAAQAMLNHSEKGKPSLRDTLRKGGATITRTGSSGTDKPKAEYAALGGKNATPRTDISITGKKGERHRYSVKQGSAQLASAEPGEANALLRSAAKKYAGKDEAKHADVHSHIDRIIRAQKSGNHALANRHLQTMLKAHPKMHDAISQEAASGEAKFGKDSESSAPHMLSYDLKGNAKVIASKKASASKIEIRKGKGKGSGGKQRPPALRIDMKGPSSS